jgi:mersacidin/lichenicidin family type 2 lantibiotic
MSFSNTTKQRQTTRKEAQMQTVEIVKAWKDSEYRETLTTEQLDQLPEHPSGVIEIAESEEAEKNSFGLRPVACKQQTGLKTNGCCFKSF